MFIADYKKSFLIRRIPSSKIIQIIVFYIDTGKIFFILRFMADKKTFVRVWTAFDPIDVKKHLLLIDDLYGSCANCKQLGLNYLKDKECPGCKTVFKYVTTNLKGMDDVKKFSEESKK